MRSGVWPPTPPSSTTWTACATCLALLGDPQQSFRAVHIAGTKGKGSTAAMIESVLRAAGYRTGLYTSPHLHTFRERIQVDGELIPEEDVVRLVEEMRPLVDQVPEITTFEVMTCLAFAWFAEQGVEWAVVEVGLGGRLDATNVLDPAVAVITSISLDHTAFWARRVPRLPPRRRASSSRACRWSAPPKARTRWP